MYATKINSRAAIIVHYRANYSTKQVKTSAEYCCDNVKKYDYENYMCTLLLKNAARSTAFAIRGFNVEIARISEQVSQPQIGFMRMKFWEETIDKCYLKDPKRVPDHPVAIEIFKALNRSKLTKRYFMSLIDSRRECLQSTSFYTLEDMEKYADKSVSSVLFLILEGSGINNVNADHAASHLGKAQGIVNQLRCIPLAQQLKVIPLPKEILAKHKVSEEEIYRGKPSEQLSECAFEVASRAYQHLTKARSLIDKLPNDAKSVLLPAVGVDLYLNRLQLVHHDVLSPALQKRHWKLGGSIWLKNFQNKY